MMSQNTYTDKRRQAAAQRWSRCLMDNSTEISPDGKLREVLKDLAEEYDKRIPSPWDNNIYSMAWRDYFAAALKRVLRELPDYQAIYSIEELRKAIARLEGINPPAEATAPLNANAADANTPTASKPVDTCTTDTTFKVDTQGDYKARIVEDGTLEFLLSGPATVLV
ncbi:hypothetical protein B0H65DRAFT_490130, partial [Neurospora tetraspora]